MPGMKRSLAVHEIWTVFVMRRSVLSFRALVRERLDWQRNWADHTAGSALRWKRTQVRAKSRVRMFPSTTGLGIDETCASRRLSLVHEVQKRVQAQTRVKQSPLQRERQSRFAKLRADPAIFGSQRRFLSAVRPRLTMVQDRLPSAQFRNGVAIPPTLTFLGIAELKLTHSLESCWTADLLDYTPAARVSKSNRRNGWPNSEW